MEEINIQCLNNTGGVTAKQCIRAIRIAFGHNVNITRYYNDPESLEQWDQGQEYISPSPVECENNIYIEIEQFQEIKRNYIKMVSRFPEETPRYRRFI